MISVYHGTAEGITSYYTSGYFKRASIENPELFVKVMGYTHVANVLTDDLNVAFLKTNHVDYPWQRNSGVEEIAPGGKRSTSTGDLLKTEHGYYIVETCGFRKLTLDKDFVLC